MLISDYKYLYMINFSSAVRSKDLTALETGISQLPVRQSVRHQKEQFEVLHRLPSEFVQPSQSSAFA